MPKLSVIVPVYNTAKYLRECIDSILAQTFTDFELILVDDGSTDGSGAICDEYAGQDSRIIVIHQENGGVTRARKAAMHIASGNWISFIDSDDWISPAMFDTMLEKATANASQIIICDAFMEFPNKSEIAGSLAPAGSYDKDAMAQQIYPTMIMSFEHRRPGMAGSLCNKLFERSLLEKVFWSVDDSFVYSEDALCTYAALFESDRIYVLRTPLYHYRQHADSAMHQYVGTKRYLNLLRSYNAHKDMLAKRGPEYLNQLYDCVAVNAISNLRKVLLLDKNTSLTERISQAKSFLSHEIIVSSFKETANKCNNPTERLKILLAMHRKIGLLYLFFSIKQVLLDLTK